MKLKTVLAMAVVGLLGASGCATLGGGAAQSAVLRAKDRVAPALVHIRPVKEIYSGGKKEEISVIGSGFIISPDGYVVTNEHVAGEAKFVRCVLYNKDELEAQVVGVDPYTDIAVLKLKSEAPLPYVKLGDSSALKAGETVLALGSPQGLARSISIGIVSVTDRYPDTGRDEEVSPYNNWIQTDAAINSGNSGGPLVNIRGEVIGVNARKLAGVGIENIGFAIPIDIVKEVVEKIMKDGRVARSWLGESLQPMRVKTEDPKAKGVVIGDVDQLSPGYEAGLKPGDILLSVDGRPTDARFEEDLPVVRKTIADIPVGKEVVVHVRRGEQEMDLKVKTAEKSLLKGAQVEFTEWGCTAVDLTEGVVRRAQLASRKGLLVTGTQTGGFAANAHLQNGDIVLKIDGAEVTDLKGFDKQYRAVVDGKKPLVMLEVKRGALTRFVLIKQDLAAPPEAAAPAAPEPGKLGLSGPNGEGGKRHAE